MPRRAALPMALQMESPGAVLPQGTKQQPSLGARATRRTYRCTGAIWRLEWRRGARQVPQRKEAVYMARAGAGSANERPKHPLFDER